MTGPTTWESVSSHLVPWSMGLSRGLENWEEWFQVCIQHNETLDLSSQPPVSGKCILTHCRTLETYSLAQEPIWPIISIGQIWDILRIKKKKKCQGINPFWNPVKKRWEREQDKHLSCLLCIKVSHGNRKVDVGKLYIEKCYLLNAEIIVELEYNHFVNFNEILDLCNDQE